MRKAILAFLLCLLPACYTDMNPELGFDTLEVLNKRTQVVLKSVPNVYKLSVCSDVDMVYVYILDAEQGQLYLVYQFRTEYLDWRWAESKPEKK